MFKREKPPYGYIYKVTNTSNGKVYIGKTEKTIEKRWGKHLSDARALEREREVNHNKKVLGTHFDNALVKYGPDAFNVKQEDVAYSKEELNELERYYVKENDSMNPDKGYNMTEGGDGGRLSAEAMEKLIVKLNTPEYKENMSKIIKEKWQDEEFIEKQIQASKEMWKNPEYRERQREINKERWENPEYREKVTEAIK